MSAKVALHRTLQACSIIDMEELTVRQARELLAQWSADQAAITTRRDEVIRAAVDAGLSKSEVHRRTGIARTTIDRILTAHSVPDGAAIVQPGGRK
jgi:predicted dienelactone hydrolase